MYAYLGDIDKTTEIFNDQINADPENLTEVTVLSIHSQMMAHITAFKNKYNFDQRVQSSTQSQSQTQLDTSESPESQSQSQSQSQTTTTDFIPYVYTMTEFEQKLIDGKKLLDTLTYYFDNLSKYHVSPNRVTYDLMIHAGSIVCNTCSKPAIYDNLVSITSLKQQQTKNSDSEFEKLANKNENENKNTNNSSMFDDCKFAIDFLIEQFYNISVIQHVRRTYVACTEGNTFYFSLTSRTFGALVYPFIAKENTQAVEMILHQIHKSLV